MNYQYNVPTERNKLFVQFKKMGSGSLSKYLLNAGMHYYQDSKLITRQVEHQSNFYFSLSHACIKEKSKAEDQTKYPEL